ncbi:MAG: 1,4-alpha-glucan branching protein GlgB [Bauldia sp.]|nr:1,4-alpha-glucan branching protein GlgB [Bauldia sp.]
MAGKTPRDQASSERPRGKAKTAASSKAAAGADPAVVASAAGASASARRSASAKAGEAGAAGAVVNTAASAAATAAAADAGAAALAPPGGRLTRPSAVLRADVIDAIVSARHGDPFSVLGAHEIAPGQWEIRAFLPQASRAVVISRDGKRSLSPMFRAHPAGFFIATIRSDGKPAYCLAVDSAAGSTVEHDPYAFGSSITGDELAALRDVGSDRPYHILGTHSVTLDGVKGFRFAVWAPNAQRVSVVGDFNGWDGRRHPMRLRHEAGVWELFIPGVTAGRRYKYEIRTPAGALLPLKSDPFAFAAEIPPATASIVADLPDFPVTPRSASARIMGDPRKEPISIYEVHLGSWMRVPEEGGRPLTYRELAAKLIPYVLEMGFTHIELLPITEHPFDGSWGYQPVSLFAPTSRFGTPEDFMAFVDAAHEAGIGILLDWVPGHFPIDAHGLAFFDGTHLYEHADPRQGFHQDWGTAIYNFGRAEVAAFLTANARFWLERYRLDGLRVDAVASMLYLDYSRKHGEWVPNQFGGRENLEAISFLRRVNEATYANAPGIITVAEESTAFGGVSHPTYDGGLGFGFKWNMGWMHDTLRYIKEDPVHRRYHHNDLSFGLLYAFSENFVLPLSHDEVVHGKGSILGRMPGDHWQRFANLRAYYGFMWGHPGKKLLFMGSEFGQQGEWNYRQSLDWHQAEEPLHRGVQKLVADLNGIYRGLPALHQRDCEASGFQWLVGDDAENSVIAWLRRGDGGAEVVVVCNFTPVPRHGYRIGVPAGGFYREALNTDAAIYGGGNIGNGGGVHAEPVEAHGQAQSISLTLPPLAALFLVRG